MSIYVASTHSRTARWCSRAFGPGAAHSLRFRSATQMIRAKRIIPFVVAIAIVLALGSGVYLRLRGGDTGAGDGDGGGGGAAVPTPAAAAGAFATDVAFPVQGAAVGHDTIVRYRDGGGQAAAARRGVLPSEASGALRGGGAGGDVRAGVRARAGGAGAGEPAGRRGRGAAGHRPDRVRAGGLRGGGRAPGSGGELPRADAVGRPHDHRSGDP